MVFFFFFLMIEQNKNICTDSNGRSIRIKMLLMPTDLLPNVFFALIESNS